MSRDLPLTVAAALTVPPLDLGSVVAGQRGLTREVLWVDIMHAPAESFVRPGDLVLTTGADVRQPGVLDFLTYVVTSAAAGVVISPPPEAAVDELLVTLVPYAEQHEFPVVVLPWEVAFSAVQRSLLPLLTPLAPDELVQMVIGRRERDDAGWNDFAEVFAKNLQELALAAGVTVKSSVTDDLVMSHFSPAPSSSTVSALVEAAKRLNAIQQTAVSWVLLPPQEAVNAAATTAPRTPAPEGPVGPVQFADVLRQHPQCMAIVLQTLQPLIDYDRTRRGQLVRTLEVLLDEATNISAAARTLYLNRHSLLYRIKLIEELTGLSLKNPTDRFQLEVSVRVHQINEARTTAGRAARLTT
ncbi:PucR family transcriptional regulator ligand-binding domain-containing protein [Mycolicibacterium smegmatis]|uniref:PucR family transcriptional regulator n=1 Tax=Mycolicibacterium smegmatis TaxID=1772 RepID=UPI0020A3ADB8|nr:PucR family transcriptional regulator [Mycolicibacterium smegmatis]MCP2621410.1 PucR family transcriptional regulator ligand-binding domain-containing protein [Mycolicibacterium smegmatis]MCP2622834.1 PucR family transcriptional regulator ligand-binding domain-containing protein [Mycolicibacterium smegmatis]